MLASLAIERLASQNKLCMHVFVLSIQIAILISVCKFVCLINVNNSTAVACYKSDDISHAKTPLVQKDMGK